MRNLVLRSMTVALLLTGGVAACGGQVTDPKLVGEGRKVLFIGNSYTYVNDLPGIVQALADSAKGNALAVETVAYADFALVDHWNEGASRSEIARGGWEWVVLQQGPSSVEVNRDTLRLFARAFATEIAKAGAVPALFSAWPTIDRRQDFDRAIDSYKLAAANVNGVFLPVAPAWLAAWQRSPNLSLYASDGLHANLSGSYLAALVIYGRLLGKSPMGLPSSLRLHSGQRISIDPQLAQLLQQAAAAVLAE